MDGDLLSAALSESGLDDLLGLDFDDGPSRTPGSAVLDQPQPTSSTPQPKAEPPQTPSQRPVFRTVGPKFSPVPSPAPSHKAEPQCPKAEPKPQSLKSEPAKAPSSPAPKAEAEKPLPGSPAKPHLLCHDYGVSTRPPASVLSRLKAQRAAAQSPPQPTARPSPAGVPSPRYVLRLAKPSSTSSVYAVASPAQIRALRQPRPAQPQTIRLASGQLISTNGATVLASGRPRLLMRPAGAQAPIPSSKPLYRIGTVTFREPAPAQPNRTLLAMGPGLKRTLPPGSKTAKSQEEAKRPRPDAEEEERRELESAAPEAAEEDEDLGHAETYADYRPAKLRSGLPHPDVVVETSSLSSVPPPEIRYQVAIPDETIDSGKISALQLESVIYASQQHSTRLPGGQRCGYLIGDGPGVGKGRTLAALILENYLRGRKRSLWFSISADLKLDAERDLSDIGAANIPVHALNKMPYARISKIAGRDGAASAGVKKGVIFATYSSLIGESHGVEGKSKYKTRLKQLIHWCGKDFDGLIVFDECHRAKNLVPIGGQRPTKTGAAVLELQKALPLARIVYASATGATEPRNMAYMTRLGLWGQGRAFADFMDFISSVERRGVGAMELVAMDLKQRGLYLARQLSFAGVSFRIEEVPLSREFVAVYDASVRLWMQARQNFALAAELVRAERGERKTIWAQFWAAHQRFFKYLCIASKVRAVVKVAREAVKNGKSVVIGLQSTGETKTLEFIDEAGADALQDFVSTAKAVLHTLIQRHFPTSSDRCLGLGESSFCFSSDFYSSATQRRHHRRPPASASIWTSKGDSDSGSASSSGEESGDDKSSADEENGEDWLKSLLEEEAKSSHSEDSQSDEEPADEGTEAEKKEAAEEAEEVEEELNPFAADLDDSDLWAAQQQEQEEEEAPPASEPEEKGRRRRRKSRVTKLRRKRERRDEERGGAEAASSFMREAREVAAEVGRSGATSEGRAGLELNLSRVEVMKAELLAEVERLGDTLPPNTLDQLISELGGAEAVAEMTGRKGRVVSRDDGVVYELRGAGGDVHVDMLNVAEKNKFMSGEKRVAIISEAASSGISLQADRRAGNTSRRVHITMELPWSADKAVQQFGRTHRSNQVSAPEYLFLISELAGERRFASVVAKRLESLGALTHGDRRATESRDLSQFNLDTKFGRKALEETMAAVLGQAAPRVPAPADYPQADFFADVREYLVGVGLLGRDADGAAVAAKDAKDLNKFLNRLLGLPVHAQNALFQYFTDTMGALTEEAKKDGRYDMGILDLGSGPGAQSVERMETRVYVGGAESGAGRVELIRVRVERGLSWEEARDLYQQHLGEGDGFYLQSPGAAGSAKGAKVSTAALVVSAGRKRLTSGARLYNLYRPNTGVHHSLETVEGLRARGMRRVAVEEAEGPWRAQFEGSLEKCQHSLVLGSCRAGAACEVGRRQRSYHVLAGSVLSVWPTLEAILCDSRKLRPRLQVIRVRTSAEKIVGIWVPKVAADALHNALAASAQRHFTLPKAPDRQNS